MLGARVPLATCCVLCMLRLHGGLYLAVVWVRVSDGRFVRLWEHVLWSGRWRAAAAQAQHEPQRAWHTSVVHTLMQGSRGAAGARGEGAAAVQEQAELQTRRDAERSAREEAEAQLKLDNEERMRRLTTFQALAADRMHKQQASLGPLMVNLKQSHAELTEAENLQVRPPRRPLQTHPTAQSACERHCPVRLYC